MESEIIRDVDQSKRQKSRSEAGERRFAVSKLRSLGCALRSAQPKWRVSSFRLRDGMQSSRLLNSLIATLFCRTEANKQTALKPVQTSPKVLVPDAAVGTCLSHDEGLCFVLVVAGPQSCCPLPYGDRLLPNGAAGLESATCQLSMRWGIRSQQRMNNCCWVDANIWRIFERSSISRMYGCYSP